MSSVVASTNHPTSGDADIDHVRAEVRESKTTADNYELRGFLMKLWVVALQQQGAMMEDFMRIDQGLSRIVFWNTLHQGGKSQEYTSEQMEKLTSLIDEGYTILESIQNRLSEGNLEMPRAGSAPADSKLSKPNSKPTPWPNYKGNPGRTGYTGSPGPRHGVNAWKFPVGLGWEARPVIEDGLVYTSTPGMRNIFQCLKIETGEPVWTTRQVVELMGDQLYNTPSITSSPVVLDNSILVREMGSRGNKGQTRHVVQIDKKSGKEIGQWVIGHVDYRNGYAPLAGNEDYTVGLHGKHDIEGTPPSAQGFNHVVCLDTKTGKRLWKYYVTPTFAEPVIEKDRIWVGTRAGYLYCLKADGNHWEGSSKRIAWNFQAGGAINRAVAIDDHAVYFGANDGIVYCLDRESGKLIWKEQVAEADPHAFRQFSTPLIHEGRVSIGGSDKQLHCLDAQTGKVIFRLPANDWVRACPAAIGDTLFYASLKGTLFAARIDGSQAEVKWSLQLGEHPIFADLAAADGHIVANTSNLYTFCVNAADGKIAWERAMLAGFMKDGHKIHTEQIAGGAYYQSKPTAADGMMFFGTPSRFVYALDAYTGEEIWKFELGAAVSGSPEYYKGRIYIGQQGGENEFYCLDAKTGKPVWTQSIGWVWGSPCVTDGQVFVPEIEGWANALDAETGAIQWRFRSGKSLCTEPFVWKDFAYFGGWDRFMYAFDRKSGKLRWQFQQGGGSDSGAPIVTEDGRIFLSKGADKFHALDAKTGEVLWMMHKPYMGFNVSPAYHDGKVYIGLQRGRGLGGIPINPKVLCVDADTGKELWEHEGGGLTGAVVGKDGKVYIASTSTPFLYCLNPENGELIWAYRFGDKVEESVPCLYAGMLYIMSGDGYMHAIR